MKQREIEREKEKKTRSSLKENEQETAAWFSHKFK